MAALSCAGFLEFFSYAMTLRVPEVLRSLPKPARDVNGSYQSDSAHSDILAGVLRQFYEAYHTTENFPSFHILYRKALRRDNTCFIKIDENIRTQANRGHLEVYQMSLYSHLRTCYISQATAQKLYGLEVKCGIAYRRQQASLLERPHT